MTELGECRCCRKPIPRSKLACPPHWDMLSERLRGDIFRTYSRRAWREYAAFVTEADGVWQAVGLWKPPVPMSARATKQLDLLKTQYES